MKMTKKMLDDKELETVNGGYTITPRSFTEYYVTLDPGETKQQAANAALAQFGSLLPTDQKTKLYNAILNLEGNACVITINVDANGMINVTITAA